MSTLSDPELKNRLEHGVWLDEIDRAFRVWRAAANADKPDLLLTGPVLTWAESWRMTSPQDFSPNVQTYISRSLAAQSFKTSTEREATDSEVRRRDKVYQQLLLLMALFVIVTLAPQAMRLYFAPTEQEAAIIAEAERQQAATETPHRQRAASAIVDATEPLPPRMEYWSAGHLLDRARTEGDAGNTRAATLFAIEALDSVQRQSGPPDRKAAARALSALSDLGQTHHALSSAGIELDGERPLRACADGVRSIGYTTSQHLAFVDTQRRLTARGLALAAFNPDAIDAACSHLVITGQDYDVSLVALDSGKAKTLGTHDAAVVGQAFSGDGRRVVSVSRDAVGKVWDVATGRRLATFRSDAQMFNGAAVNADGSRVISWSDDKSAEVWDGTTGKRLAALDGHQSAVIGARFNPAGTRLLTVSLDGTAILWDSTTHARLTTVRPRGGSLVDAWQLPDGQHIATRLDDNRLQIWNHTADTPVADIQLPDSKIQHVATRTDGRQIAVFEPAGQVSIFETSTGERLLSLTARTRAAQAATFKGGAFSADGAQLTAITAEGLVTWPLLHARDQAIATLDAKRLCWSTAERTSLRLDPSVPDWCPAAAPVTAADPLP